MSDRNAGRDLQRDTTQPLRLKDALRRARIEAAERTAVVVDLRDAELARLEIMNEALDPVFAEIPDQVDIFDRGISQGDTPRLWIDVVAHIVMGRDKRQYRLVQDTRFGRIVLAETHDVPVMVKAITDYVARRMVERERALSATSFTAPPVPVEATPVASTAATRFATPISAVTPSRVWTFAFGFAVGVAALFGFALIATLRAL
jgi:hypothetical protein